MENRSLNMIDISIVTYNSEKHLRSFVDSILTQDIDLAQVSLYFQDNGSTDRTIKFLEELLQPHYNRFCTISIVFGTNVGFGCGHNKAIARGHAPYVFVLNPDIELKTDTLSSLLAHAQQSDIVVAAWEARQLPYEHPKFYNPVTLETDWVSGAAVLFRRKAFEEVQGFDPRIFLYCEDVDISFRLRHKGYKLLYCPKVSVSHHTYAHVEEVKPAQYLGSTLGNLYIRTRFGKITDIFKGVFQYLALLFGKRHFPKQKRRLLKNFGKYLHDFYYFWSTRKRGVSIYLNGFEYNHTRLGAFYNLSLASETPSPKVSVLIRSIGRKTLVCQALTSLANQTYANLEVILVEDGPATLDDCLKKFSSLKITYHPLGIRQGRCSAGNEAMRLATGDYFIFLDEDDLFFADHIEQLVLKAIKENKRAVYSLAAEIPTKLDPLTHEVNQEGMPRNVYTESFCLMTLAHHNYIPILNLLFHRSLFLECGGFNPRLEQLEDWDLFLRFAVWERHFAYIPKTTALYRVPLNKKEKHQRHAQMVEFYKIARQEHAPLRFEISVEEMARFYDENASTSAIIRRIKTKILNRFPKWQIPLKFGARLVRKTLSPFKF